MNPAELQAIEETALSSIEWAAYRFTSADIDSPRLTAELLMSHVFGCRRSELRPRLAHRLNSTEVELIRSLVARRLGREPLQYIVGSTEFMGLRFEVNKSTLIPRPETEVLVEQVIKHATTSDAESAKILDIGTGSGNIAVSLAHFLPAAHITAIDISQDALAVAARNVAAHNVGSRVKLLELDLCAAHHNFARHEFDYVVSNPPYVAPWEIGTLSPEIRDHEPLHAVIAPAGGTWFFRPIARAAQRILKSGGCLFLEIGFSQDEEVSRIVEDERFEGISVFKDYEGLPRIVRGQVPAG